jgi:hypothetical protein
VFAVGLAGMVSSGLMQSFEARMRMLSYLDFTVYLERFLSERSCSDIFGFTKVVLTNDFVALFRV